MQMSSKEVAYGYDGDEEQFQSYMSRLFKIAEYYDEYYSDNMWRMMTHEAIKNFDWSFNKEINHNLKEVHEANDADKNEERFDAREEGKNKYYNPKQKNKKKNGKDSDKVTMKSQSHLDIKI